jgi:translation initiation factor 2-alpha kinase 4
VIAHLREVIDYTKRFQVRSKIYVSPLCSIKERFCKGGVVFSCLYGKKVKDVFAAGGRYDSLVKEHRHKIGTSFQQRHAVGFNLGLERLVKHPRNRHKASSKRVEEEVNGIWSTKRVRTRISSHDKVLK